MDRVPCLRLRKHVRRWIKHVYASVDMAPSAKDISSGGLPQTLGRQDADVLADGQTRGGGGGGRVEDVDRTFADHESCPHLALASDHDRFRAVAIKTQHPVVCQDLVILTAVLYQSRELPILCRCPNPNMCRM
jgi:hypothetical protein